MSRTGTSQSVASPTTMMEALESRALLSSSPLGVAGGLVPWQTPAAAGATAAAVSTTARPPAVASAAAAKPTPLGGNANVQSDRVQDHPFTDLVKLTRGFYNLAGRTYAANGKPAFAATDANGWPVEDFSFSAADNAEYGAPIDAGVYHMSFTGPATTLVQIRRDAPAGAGVVPAAAPLPTIKKVGFNAATSTNSYDVTVPDGVLTLAFDFRNTGGRVKNVKLLQPGYAFATAPLFTAAYLNLMRSLNPASLRLKDWTHTDNNLTATWATRAHVTDATQAKVSYPGDLQPAKGIAWEYAIALARALNVGSVWVNVPAHADDTYVQDLALLLKNGLAANQTIYLEYSNEVWNTGYEQGVYNRNRAAAEVLAAYRAGKRSDLNYDNLKVYPTQAYGGANITTWADRLYARRSTEVADLFRDAWKASGGGDPINTRVRVVLASQIQVLPRFNNMLKYLSTEHGAPGKWFYGIGIAPYNSTAGMDEPGVTKDQILALFSASINYLQNGPTLTTAKAIADQYKLKMLAYEGSMATYGTANVLAKRAAVLDPRMEQIVERYLRVWYAKGGDLFEYVTLGARSFLSPYGTWSITNDIRNYSEPKEVAFRNVRNAGLGR